VRGGMSNESALRALTIHGAQMLHLDDRLGSLEKGKDADFVVLDGEPFSVYTHVLETYIDGERVFDRSKQQDWTYQAGGFALAGREASAEDAAAEVPLPVVKLPKLPAEGAKFDGGPKEFYIIAGRLYTASHGTLLYAVLRVKDGKIVEVSKLGELGFKLNPELPILTAAAVTPGLIDAHTAVGLSGRAEHRRRSGPGRDERPNQADLRVLDGFNRTSRCWSFLRLARCDDDSRRAGRNKVIAGQTGVFRRPASPPSA